VAIDTTNSNNEMMRNDVFILKDLRMLQYKKKVAKKLATFPI